MVDDSEEDRRAQEELRRKADRSMAVIAKDLERFRADAQLLDSMLPTLVQEYPYHWAGMFHGVLSIAPTQPDLIAKLTHPQRSAVKFLNPRPKTFILTYH